MKTDSSHLLEQLSVDNMQQELCSIVNAVKVNRPNISPRLAERVSSWYQLKTRVAVLQKIVQYIINKRRLHSMVITIDDQNKAERLIVYKLQNRVFIDELQTCRYSSGVKKTSRLYRLNPVLDFFGILRVGGRINKATLNDDRKHPLILSSSE